MELHKFHKFDKIDNNAIGSDKMLHPVRINRIWL